MAAVGSDTHRTCFTSVCTAPGSNCMSNWGGLESRPTRELHSGNLECHIFAGFPLGQNAGSFSSASGCTPPSGDADSSAPDGRNEGCGGATRLEYSIWDCPEAVLCSEWKEDCAWGQCNLDEISYDPKTTETRTLWGRCDHRRREGSPSCSTVGEWKRCLACFFRFMAGRAQVQRELDICDCKIGT